MRAGPESESSPRLPRRQRARHVMDPVKCFWMGDPSSSWSHCGLIQGSSFSKYLHFSVTYMGRPMAGLGSILHFPDGPEDRGSGQAHSGCWQVLVRVPRAARRLHTPIRSFICSTTFREHLLVPMTSQTCVRCRDTSEKRSQSRRDHGLRHLAWLGRVHLKA